MASPARRFQPDRRSGERWWCSHLMELTDARGNTEIVNMENIGPGGAGVAAETAFELGERLTLRADGFERAVIVRFCNVRENDFAVGLAFEVGFRWSPEVWTPGHLLPIPDRDGER